MGRRKIPPETTLPPALEILEIIDKLGWTQKEVELVSGVSQSFISQLRRGRRVHVSAVLLYYLGLSVGYKLTFVKMGGRPRTRPFIRTQPDGKPKVRRQKAPYAGKDPNEQSA